MRIDPVGRKILGETMLVVKAISVVALLGLLGFGAAYVLFPESGVDAGFLLFLLTLIGVSVLMLVIGSVTRAIFDWLSGEER